jgi:hypothetical protein
MKNLTTDIFNAGEDLSPVIAPDNKSTFLLTEDECALINIVNLQLSTLKTILFSVISTVEQQIETVSLLKDQFIFALADKHSISVEKNKEHAFEIDIANKLLVIKDNKN